METKIRGAPEFASAKEAISYLLPVRALCVGNGNTHHFVARLHNVAREIFGAVVAPQHRKKVLRDVGIAVRELQALSDLLPVYVDGAGEVDTRLRLIKGGGHSAHAREDYCQCDGLIVMYQ